jgi:integrase
VCGDSDGDTSGPQVGHQSRLQFGQSDQVGPRRPIEDCADSAVVDAAETPDLAGGATIHRLFDPVRQRARYLDNGIAGGLVRPVVHKDSGHGASGAGHTRRIRLTIVPEPDPHAELVGALINDGYYHHSEVTEGGDPVSHRIASFDPSIPPAHWAVLEEFVRAAVADCAPESPEKARLLLIVSARHVHWCWQSAGLPLERDVIFRREVIAESIATTCAGMAISSQGTYRSRLFGMSDLLLSAPLRAARPPSIGKAQACAPYTETEVTALWSWARGQNTEYRRVNATLLLALGLGAGLSAAEIAGAQARHVLIDSDGVQIDVPGERARLVPVLAEWEAPLAELARSAIRGNLWLFCARRQVCYPKNVVSNFVRNTVDRPVGISSQRLRTSWLCGHLLAGTPVHVLVDAAGIDTLEALSRYVPYLPDIDPRQARRLLRRNIDPFTASRHA